MSKPSIPAVSVTYAHDGTSTHPNALGMRPMQERAYQKRGEQYLPIKSPPASGKSRGKVGAVQKFLASDAKVLVCTHATFRFAVDKFGIEVFDDRLIAVDEFHYVSANPDNKLGDHMRQLMSRDKTHIVAMTGSYFRGDAEAVMHPEDESRFDTITYTYYEQFNGKVNKMYLPIEIIIVRSITLIPTVQNLDVGYFR
jgi:superfamily II DNA or RNA helicase